MRLLFLMLVPLPAMADSVVATRTIRAQSMLTAQDVTLVAEEIPGAMNDLISAIGQEARVAIYAGRPIKSEDVGPTAIIERNQMISLAYTAGGLAIMTEGRALNRGGVGDTIAVMNLASRSTVMGQIGPDGIVHVGPNS